MALAQVGYQTLLKVISYLLQRSTAVAVVKVIYPTSHGGIDFIHYPFKRHNCPRSFREFGQSVFDLLQGFLQWLNMGIHFPSSSALSHPD
jgi:hypothetical protein